MSSASFGELVQPLVSARAEVGPLAPDGTHTETEPSATNYRGAFLARADLALSSRRNVAVWVTAIALVLVSAGAPFGVLAQRGGSVMYGWLSASTLAIVGISAAVVSKHMALAAKAAKRFWPLSFLLMWLTASLVWSVHSGVSINWLVYAVPLFFAFAVLCALLDLAGRVAVIHLAMLLSFALGAVWSLKYPGLAKGTYGYQGSFVHNNFAGHAGALGVTTGVAWGILRPRSLVVAGPGVIICALVVKASNSDTAAVVLVVAIAACLASFALSMVMRRFRKQHARIFGAVSVGLSAVVMFLTKVWWDRLHSNSPLARDENVTLNRRTDIWRAVIPSIERHRWTGYGAGRAAFEVLQAEFDKGAGFAVVHVHNAYLDSMLMGGIPALLCVAALFAVGFRQFFLALIPAPRVAAVRLLLIVAIGSLNFTEPDLLHTMYPTMFALLAAIAPSKAVPKALRS